MSLQSINYSGGSSMLDEEKKEKRKQYCREYYQKNKEAKKERDKKNAPKYVEKRKEYLKKYYEENREKLAEQSKKRYLRRKEKILEKRKEYLKSLPPEEAERRRQHKIRYGREMRSKGKFRPHTWKKLGIDLTLEKFKEIGDSQGWCCKICGISQDNLGHSLHVDHDHNTLKIRGLLCSQCNTGIGLLKENVEILKSAIFYLENSKNI
jgi:hypothetical protein